MPRPHTSRTLVGLVGCVAVFTLAIATAAQSAPALDRVTAPREAPAASAAEPRPNILLITTDDMTAADLTSMPKTRRLLGRHGATFTNAFSNNPLCCPARATLLTGRYSHNHGVYTNYQGLGGGFAHFDDRSTLPVWLRGHGYITGFAGKYLNGYGRDDPRYIPPGWTDWRGSIDNWTYYYFHIRLNENGRVTRYPGDYSTFVIQRKTTAFIDRYAQSRRPFFHWTSFVAPHNGGPIEDDDPKQDNPGAIATPARPPTYAGLFDDVPMPRDPNFNEEDTSDKPSYVARPPMSENEIAHTEEQWRQRQESLVAVDDAVASIVSTLRENRVLSNTLIIFTSDNGYLSGQHRLHGKIRLYRPSVRVPLLLRGPGVGDRLRVEEFTGLIDVAPTVLVSAGVRHRVDGRSMYPALRDPGLQRPRTLVFEGGRKDRLDYAAIRTADWVYAEYRSGDVEMYDMQNDPWQLQSLHDDPRYTVQRHELAAELSEMRECRGAACR